MGRAHPFEAMLGAAELLRDEAPDVRFVFVGAGARREWIADRIASRGLGNTILLPYQPKANLAQSLSAADLHLVSMEAALEGLVVPSKLYGVAAAGRPCLFMGPRGSEASRFIARTQSGDVLSRPTSRSVADAIQKWSKAPDQRTSAGLRAREAAVDGRARAFDRFDNLVSSLH